jgi:hypothetical protein
MQRWTTGARCALTLALLAALPVCAAAEPVALSPPAAFVAPGFSVPTAAATPQFKLIPLGPALVKIDFEAYMSSVEHLQKTFTRSTDWPHAGISDADAMKDMETEAARFQARTSFAYSVLTPDGTRERGCVYVSPSPAAGYDAQVLIWVTKAEYDAGFDAELYAWAQTWVKTQWPFKKVAWPGRAIDWATWDAAVAANKKS